MKHCIGMAVIAVVALSATGYAKSNGDRVSELANLLPSGSELRAVWVTAGKLMAMSSQDGAINELASGGVWMPCITHDGSRVIYAGESVDGIRCVDWNGNNDRKICEPEGNGEALRYWRDRENNSDWAILENATRVNIDNTSQTEILWSGSPWPSIMDYTPLTLSRDGTRVGGHFPHPWFAVAEVPNGNIYVEQTMESCYATMSSEPR